MDERLEGVIRVKWSHNGDEKKTKTWMRVGEDGNMKWRLAGGGVVAGIGGFLVMTRTVG